MLHCHTPTQPACTTFDRGGRIFLQVTTRDTVLLHFSRHANFFSTQSTKNDQLTSGPRVLRVMKHEAWCASGLVKTIWRWQPSSGAQHQLMGCKAGSIVIITLYSLIAATRPCHLSTFTLFQSCDYYILLLFSDDLRHSKTFDCLSLWWPVFRNGRFIPHDQPPATPASCAAPALGCRSGESEKV